MPPSFLSCSDESLARSQISVAGLQASTSSRVSWLTGGLRRPADQSELMEV